MNEYKDLPAQNFTDAWSILYSELAHSSMDILGRKGEGLIRAAVREYARRRADKVIRDYSDAQKQVNMETVYSNGTAYMKDPRFRLRCQELNEEVFLLDAETCPLANRWRQTGSSRLGRYFCEEFHHAFNQTISRKTSQTNVTKTLTNPVDNHCRFAFYMRQANMMKEKRADHFSVYPPNYHEPFSIKLGYLPYAKNECEQDMINLCLSFLDAAQSFDYAESVNAIAIGLRRFGRAYHAFLAQRADMTGKKFDQHFLEEHQAVSRSSVDSDLWKNNDYALDLFEKCYLRAFSEAGAKAEKEASKQ